MWCGSWRDEALPNARPILSAVTLDVDGTLYSIRGMILHNLLALWPVLEIFRELHHVRDALRGQGPFPDLRAEQARRLAEYKGITAEQASRLITQTVDERWMRVFGRVKPFRGLLPALQGLAGEGIALGLISDYPIAPKLPGMGLAGLPFVAVINCEQVGALKPHRAPFDAALAALGLPPERVLHVGDREDSDVAGALACGMHAALFCRGKHPGASRAALVFSDWREFGGLIRERFTLQKKLDTLKP